MDSCPITSHVSFALKNVDNTVDEDNSAEEDLNFKNKQPCTFIENEYCCSHVTLNCECSYDHRGFIYQLLPKNITSYLKVVLRDIDSNTFSVECMLPAREYINTWDSILVGKPITFQLFTKLVQFFESVHQFTSYWPDVDYFGDFVVVLGSSDEGTIKFIRPTKFTTHKNYLIGLRRLFLTMCHRCATNIVSVLGPTWFQNIGTGKGVNIKYCKETTFINRPPPFVKILQEAECRRDDVYCVHDNLVEQFKRCKDKKKFTNTQETFGQTHLACSKTLSKYYEAGVDFKCHLFPEARAFFTELGRSDKLHTVFCYPDELLDVHWFNEFWNTINQYRASIKNITQEFI